ncbi:MAG TPA: DNA cytosine methyltransferase [Methylomirabilota bacterium]|nr:DNA cytosine methyltransferase [Methylomirabilota bacterium]
MIGTVRAADLFCGAGGTSTGLALACEDVGKRVDLLAVNHWPRAVESHKANHPWARHLCKSLHEIDPLKEIPRGALDLLVASPECTHHSIARGGKPMSDQMRASAFQVVDWLAKLQVGAVLIENVREFRDWGPLNSKGRPIVSRRGETFRAWLGAVASLGYTIEQRVLNAADYGDATTRERLFVIATRGRRKVRWPEPTHDQGGMVAQKWRAAREVIDWSLEGESIFGRKRPLSPNTLARIEAGLRKFSGLSFTMPVNHGPEKRSRSVEQPLPTLTGRANQYVVEPFIIGAGDPFERAVTVPDWNITPPDGVQHHGVQFTARAGLTIHRNGFPGPVRLVQQGYRNGVLAVILKCGGCGAKYNLPTWADAEPIVVAFRSEADRRGLQDPGCEKFWHAIADRIAAGYGQLATVEAKS